mgnify:CR=1 FL=1
MNNNLINKNFNIHHNIKHLAIIMDGNARWAASGNLSKAEGHKKGAEVAKELILQSLELNIPYITLYTFSSENWQRPKDEVSLLMKLLNYYVENEIKTLHKHQIRLKIVGNLDKINSELKNKSIARKSIVAKKDIKKGEILSENNLAIKRPGNGISPMRWDEIVGTVATKDYKEEELI